MAVAEARLPDGRVIRVWVRRADAKTILRATIVLERIVFEALLYGLEGDWLRQYAEHELRHALRDNLAKVEVTG